NDRHARRSADLPADLHPIQLRQHEVEQNQIGLVAAGDLQCRAAVVGSQGLEPGLSEVSHQPLNQLALIVDNQDSLWHDVSLPRYFAIYNILPYVARRATYGRIYRYSTF